MVSETVFPVSVPPGESLEQPWRSLWPWNNEGDIFEALRKEYPEILNWVYDPRDIFNSSYHCLFEQEDPPIVQKPVPRQPPLSVPSRIQQARRNLDDFIIRKSLTSVTPSGFSYLTPQEVYQRQKLFRLQLPPLPGIQTSNLAVSHYKVPIYDISGYEGNFTLKHSGFEYTKCDVEVLDWTDKHIQETYLPQMEDWLKRYLSCQPSTMVIPYSYNFCHHSQGDSFVPVMRYWDGGPFRVAQPATSLASRPPLDDIYDINAFLTQRLARRRWSEPWNGIEQVRRSKRGPCFWKQPFFRVHGDASPNTAKYRLQLCRPWDHQELLATHNIRMFSVWRQLTSSQQGIQLALCDMRTTNPGDFARIDIVHPHFVDEATEVYHNPSHRWFFRRDMGLDDVVVVKLHDGDAMQPGVTTCPHAAFVDHSVPSHMVKRTSIEVKFMVLESKESET